MSINITNNIKQYINSKIEKNEECTNYMINNLLYNYITAKNDKYNIHDINNRFNVIKSFEIHKL